MSSNMGGEPRGWSNILTESVLRQISRGDKNVREWVEEVASDLAEMSQKSAENPYSHEQLKTIILVQANDLLSILEGGGDIATKYKNHLDYLKTDEKSFRHYSDNGNDGIKEIKKKLPDLILLDWMLPDFSGVEICKNLKKDIKFKDLPIIMLTAKGEEEDKVKGLNSGADDYITKPFSFPELLARIKALLRRSKPSVISDTVLFDDLKIDRMTRRVYRKDTEVHLGPKEYELLNFFIKNPKRVYSREQLLENVWSENINVETRTIDVHIRRLRQNINLKGSKELIRTVRSAGYSLN